jgi:DNA-binding transcriptional ArsR family regulator
MSTKKGKGMKAKEKCGTPGGFPCLPEEVETILRQLGGLDRLIESLPADKALDKLAFVHSALSDPVRLRILSSLAKCDLCPCVLKEITKLSDSSLSYHLNVLEEAGLVSQSAYRRWRIYRLTEEGRRGLED